MEDLLPCYTPIRAYQDMRTGDLHFKVKAGGYYRNKVRELQLPCGSCIGCKLEKSKMWAVRCMHEARMHEDNHFLTLTYDDSHLPPRAELRPRDITLFMKRLRKRVGKVRYLYAGEYGEENGRPHYHALLFNCSLTVSDGFERGSYTAYQSDEIADTWKLGKHEVGELTFESAAYVARYSVKLLMDERKYYEYDHATQKVKKIFEPPYMRMSRRPGIGQAYYDKYKRDLMAIDGCISRDHHQKLPRFYDNKIKEEFEAEYRKIKFERFVKSLKRGKNDDTVARLADRKKYKEAELKNQKRSLK